MVCILSYNKQTTVFSPNFRTRKLGENTVFCAVLLIEINVWQLMGLIWLCLSLSVGRLRVFLLAPFPLLVYKK